MKKIFFIIFLIIYLTNANAQTAPNYTIVVVTQPSCLTCCDGVLSISSLNSACMAYTFSWSNGAFVQTIGNCCAGSTYTATITSSCGTQVQVCSISFMTTGINLSKDDKIKIYPNPSNSNFIIELSTNETQTLQVLDVSGKIVLSQRMNGKTNIDASSLDNGIYFIRVKTSENIYKQKVIVQH